MNVKDWAEKGEIISVFNTDVFVIDEGKSEDTLVLFHGYATSSIDYSKVLPELSKHYRVIIQDFVGFGFSDKPTKIYFNTLEQTDITLELWRVLDLKNITILSHNYGTKIALEIITRQKNSSINIDIKKLIFLNNTISFNQKNVLEKIMTPRQEFTKRIQLMFSSFSFYKTKIKDFFFDPNKITEDEIKARWILIEHKDGFEIIDFLSNYNTETKLLWKRWDNSIIQNTIPTKIIIGKNDIIFNELEATKFHEEFNNSELHFIDECGHYPMLEQPERLIELILKP